MSIIVCCPLHNEVVDLASGFVFNYAMTSRFQLQSSFATTQDKTPRQEGTKAFYETRARGPKIQRAKVKERL